MKKIVIFIICFAVLFTTGCVNGGEIENIKNNIYINEKDSYKIEFPESWGDYYEIVEYDDGGIGIYFRGKSDTSKKYENEGAGAIFTIVPEEKIDLQYRMYGEVERIDTVNGVNYHIERSTGSMVYLFDLIERGDVPEYDLELAKSDLEMQLKISQEYNQFIFTDLTNGQYSDIDVKMEVVENYSDEHSEEVYGIIKAFRNESLLWGYTTARGYYGTVYPLSEIYVNNDTVYFVANSALYALDIATGKEKWKVTDVGGSNCVTFDKYQNVYVSGLYGPNLVVADKNGNEVYRDTDKSYSWVEKLVVDNDTLNIHYSNSDKGSGVKKISISQFNPLKISVLLNNKKIVFDQEPVVVDGRTLVPVRKVVEAMNGSVEWNEKTQTVTLLLGENKIVLTVDSKTAYLNGEEKKLDVPPQVINGRTLMPIRFIAEGFSFNVDWNDETQTVIIRTGDGTYKDVTDSISGEWIEEFDSFAMYESIVAEMSGYLKTWELPEAVDGTHYDFLKNYDCNERNNLRQIIYNFMSATEGMAIGGKLELQGFYERFSGYDNSNGQEVWGDKAAFDMIIKEYYNIPYDIPEFNKLVEGYSSKEALYVYNDRYYSPVTGVGVSGYITDIEKVYDLGNNQYYFEYKLGSGIPEIGLDYIFGDTMYALMERKNITNEYVSNLEFWSVIKTSETSFIDEITK